MNKTYKLANSLKNSLFKEDIGVKSEGFIPTIILSTIIAFGTLFAMYYFWRV